MGFVGRNGTRFVDLRDGSPVYDNGWNSYWLMSFDCGNRVVEILRRERAMGVSVCLTWAYGDGGPNALQISPGRFDERIFKALDFVIYEARIHHISLILCLVNNLNAFGGKLSMSCAHKLLVLMCLSHIQPSRAIIRIMLRQS
ncbi:unnamed protein product [Musa textilis]